MKVGMRFIGMLMCASLVAGCSELNLYGKSAQDAFKNEGVVKLLKAAINGNALEAKHLVATGVNVNAFGEGGVTPLAWMLGAHDLPAMKILLDLGADPSKYVPGVNGEVGFGPAIYLAAGGGQKEALQAMLEHGGNSNLVFGNDSLLMMAVSGSHLDCAELLLQHGADINYSKGPMSALFVANQYRDAIWVLNHGYSHELLKGRRLLDSLNSLPGQEAMKAQALEIIDRLLAAQQKQ